ncbi:MAG: hypothetical protein NT092_05455 [Bacteroidia bacterium]|nr:hypothetical protein [Bacteroidia bacterium]
MKCLSRIEVQEYVDKELDPSMMVETSDHLEKCETCSMLLRQAIADKVLISNIIGQGNDLDEFAKIPTFAPPVLYKKKITFYRFIPYMIAVSMIGLILLFKTDKKQLMESIPEAEILMYEFYDGKDLNKMWHEKSQIIILQDEKGNVIQSIITN